MRVNRTAKENLPARTTKKTKRTGILVLSILLVLIIGIGILLWTQLNNLKAIQYARYTPEQRQELLEQQYAQLDEKLQDMNLERMNSLTKEQEEMLLRGELTEDEALQIILGSGTKSKADGSVKTDTTESDAGASETQTDEGNLQGLLARVYLLRSSFTGQLYGLVGQAKAEYISQVKTNGSADKAGIASRYISKGLALEGACDGQIEALLSEISAELKRTGGDMSLVSQIRSAYNAEKSVTKANLLSAYTR